MLRVVAQPAWWLHNTTVMCWVADFFRAEGVEPSQVLTPFACSCFLVEIRAHLLSTQTAQSSWDVIVAYSAAFWNHLCFTDGWIELVMFFCVRHSVFFLSVQRRKVRPLGFTLRQKSYAVRDTVCLLDPFLCLCVYVCMCVCVCVCETLIKDFLPKCRFTPTLQNPPKIQGPSLIRQGK